MLTRVVRYGGRKSVGRGVVVISSSNQPCFLELKVFRVFWRQTATALMMMTDGSCCGKVAKTESFAVSEDFDGNRMINHE